MQTVTNIMKDTKNTSKYSTFIEVLYFEQNSRSVDAHRLHQCETLDLYPKGYNSQNHVQHDKLLTFQTCSTLGTESDDQEYNKENLQMQSPSEINSTIPIQRRSPLKDITSKTLQSSSKMSKGTIQQELRAYMKSLFPSHQPSPFPYPRKCLRV